MFYEYAIDPAVLSNWKDARYFLDAFGPWKGRFLSEYPNHWKRLVYQSLTCGDTEKSRIEIRLKQLDRRIFHRRKDAPYDGKLAWLSNAQVMHAKLPFHLIVALGHSSAEDNIADSATLDESHERWQVHSGKYIVRDPSVLAQELKFLLLVSSRAALIDPHFRADKDECTQPLEKICKLLPPGIRNIDVHCAEEHLSYSECVRYAKRALPNVIPAGFSITVYCWKERIGGSRLHNRYFITDIGGIKFGDSIKQGDAGQQDHLNIMDEPSRALCWSEYVDPGNAFDPAGAPVEIKGK